MFSIKILSFYLTFALAFGGILYCVKLLILGKKDEFKAEFLSSKQQKAWREIPSMFRPGVASDGREGQETNI